MQSLVQVTLLVDDYDRAIEFYSGILGFEVQEDTPLTKDKRWVVVAPQKGAALVLAVADTGAQKAAMGRQTGGRVGFFLATNDFWTDYRAYQQAGVTFVREPTTNEYGTVAVFEDLYGNQWDLIQHVEAHRFAL